MSIIQNRNDYVIIVEDFNACVSNFPKQNIMERNGERTENGSGRRLTYFATFNNFWITNIFFTQEKINKWCARGSRSTVDYFLVTVKLGNLADDTRFFKTV